jgi:endonuclease-3
MAPKLFEAFPDMKALSKATPETLYPFIADVRNFANKTSWLIEIAQKIKNDKNIPLSLEESLLS